MIALPKLVALTTALLAFIDLAHADPALDRRATCNADNCARQVTGTATLPSKPDITSRAADCNSFLSTTVIPAPVIVTVTSSLAAGAQAPASSPIVTTAQTVSPTAVPSYINSCGASPTVSSRYSSACACFTSVTKGTTTLPQSTTTTTVYNSVPTFVLQASTSDGTSQGYLYTAGDGEEVLTQDPSQAQRFTFDAATGHILYNGGGQPLGYKRFFAMYDSGPLISYNTLLVCTMAAAGSGVVTCASSDGSATGVFVAAGSASGQKGVVWGKTFADAVDPLPVVIFTSEQQVTLTAVPYTGS